MIDEAHETPVSIERVPAPLGDELQRTAGINALARLSDDEFNNRVGELKRGLDRFRQMMRDLLDAEDLMSIEGVEKKVLTLSGAEKIAFVMRLVPTFVVTPRFSTVESELAKDLGVAPSATRDVFGAPPIHYTVNCSLHLGLETGPVVATGIGTANSFEKKYRYRYAERHCPKCGSIGSLLKSKHIARAGTQFAGTKPWFCWTKRNGCGAEFAEDDPTIRTQTALVDNPDPFDLDNTLAKMAKKRAFVDAIKTATASSGLVTQDLEETAKKAEPEPAATPEFRESVLAAARANGLSTLGEVFAKARGIGLPVKDRAAFEKLTTEELTRLSMLFPQAAPAAPAPPSSDDEPEDEEEDTAHGDDIPF